MMHKIAVFYPRLSFFSLFAHGQSPGINHRESVYLPGTICDYRNSNPEATDVKRQSAEFRSSNLPLLNIRTGKYQTISAAYSPDGMKIITASSYNTAKIRLTPEGSM